MIVSMFDTRIQYSLSQDYQIIHVHGIKTRN